MKQLISTIIVALCFLHASGQQYTLEQVTQLALRNNATATAARHNVEAAQEQRKQAFTNFFPSVSATGLWFNANKPMATMEINPSEVIPPELGATLGQLLPPETLAGLATPISFSMLKHGIVAGVSATQPVFAGGQIVNGNKLARVAEDASRLQLNLAENTVEKTAAQYFWQIVTLQEKSRTIAAAESLLNDIHKDVELAVRVGVAMRNDLLQVQLRQNEIASQKLRVNNAIALSHMLLAQYCGMQDTTFTLVHPATLIEPETLRRDHQTALYATNEYQLLEKQVEASKLQVRMETGKNLPTIAVGAGYNYHDLLDKGQSFGMIFATVSVPISGWWGGSHAIKQKKIEQRKAMEQQADNAQLLVIGMQHAWDNLVEAREQLSLAELSIVQAEENLRINRDHYNAGINKMSDLLEAQLLYQQACDKRTDAFADYQNKVIAYRQAVGL